MKIFISVYSHPEFYPPTLNAINRLSKHADSIDVLSRNFIDSDWDYPKNVKIHLSGKLQNIRDSEKGNVFKKISSYVKYLFKMYSILFHIKPDLVLLYDSVPLFSYFLLETIFHFNSKVWYHNHDLIQIEGTSFYSIARLSRLAEEKLIQRIDFFSLPAEERLKFFNMTDFRGKFFYIPNLPSLEFYNQFYRSKEIDDVVILLYQGFINENKGIEEIIQILDQKIQGKSLKLVLKGTIRDNFKEKLETLAAEKKVSSSIEFVKFGSYKEVPKVGQSCHIGIGIHHSRNDMVGTTLGTASNKIYEYAALGLPVLVYDSEHYRNHLGYYEWAVFSDLTVKSLTDSIEKIIMNYQKFASNAHKSFTNELNFEHFFEFAVLHISDSQIPLN